MRLFKSGLLIHLEKEVVNSSFDELYKEFSDDILRYAYSILKNYEEAKDIVQEVFIRHFEKEESFKGQCSFKTWLFVIARNLCYSRLRSKNFHNESIEEYSFKKIIQILLISIFQYRML